ncbi:MAG: Biotin synthase [Turneriella sp.]|nr:Biotin synthase [Turneriella sp.]
MKVKEKSAITREEAQKILEGKVSYYDALARAAALREKFFGKKVRIQVLDNIKNGNCAENCCYCAQRKEGASPIETYLLKSDEEIFADAQKAKENGAYRFCMVTSGTGLSSNTAKRLSHIIRRIHDELGIKVCLSAGFVDKEKATLLRDAGLDRYNHNLNTSEKFYPQICTTHTYEDRIKTVEAVKSVGVSLCSGVIIGMGETVTDIVDVAFMLKELGIESIPVNFFIPVPGHVVKNPTALNPEFCLRVLIVFRLINPDAEIRMAAGREGHLRSLQATALLVANSLFASGYLNVKGSSMQETLALIKDIGYVSEVESGGADFFKNEGELTINSYKATNFPELLKFPKKTKALK